MDQARIEQTLQWQTLNHSDQQEKVGATGIEPVTSAV